MKTREEIIERANAEIAECRVVRDNEAYGSAQWWYWDGRIQGVTTMLRIATEE